MNKYCNDKLSTVYAIALVLLAIIGLSACKQQPDSRHTDHLQEYTCSMHPEIVRPAPGQCPICGMDLVPLDNAGRPESLDTTSFETTLLPVSQSVLSKIGSVRPVWESHPADLVAQGQVTFDTRRFATISARVAGRIERLYIKYNRQPVRKGQKIMDLYSPDLAAAQQEYRYLINQSLRNELLQQAARQRLLLLGMTEGQLETLERAGEIFPVVEVFSPVSGYAVDFQTSQGPPTPTASVSGIGGGGINSDGMGSGAGIGGSASTLMPSAITAGFGSVLITGSTPSLGLREGQYVGAGEGLFRVYDGESLWVEAFLPPSGDIAPKVGSSARIQAVGDSTAYLYGKISLVQPFFQNGQPWQIARIPIVKAGETWRPGQLAQVHFHLPGRPAWWLPRSAVLVSGVKSYVFIKKDGAFVAKTVQRGRISGDWVEILDTLDGKAEFAANTWFLTDSESFIKAEQ